MYSETRRERNIIEKTSIIPRASHVRFLPLVRGMIELNSFYPSSLNSLLLLYQTVHWKRKGLFKDTLLIEFTVNRCVDHHQSSQAKITKDVAQFDPGCRSEPDKHYAKTRSRFVPGRTQVSNGVNKFWSKPRLKLIRVEPGLNSQKRTSFNRSFDILE